MTTDPRAPGAYPYGLRASDLVASDAEKEWRRLADVWDRYTRNDLSREEFEGYIAERVESPPGCQMRPPVPDHALAGMRAPAQCSHPTSSLIEVGGVARWCGICGALYPDHGPLAAQWLQPKATELHRIRERLAVLLATIDGALIESESPR